MVVKEEDWDFTNTSHVLIACLSSYMESTSIPLSISHRRLEHIERAFAILDISCFAELTKLFEFWRYSEL